MKKLLSLCILVLLAGCIRAQNKIDHLPNFHILTTDSVRMTSANLKQNKPVMIIYFAPDCGHCQHLMAEMRPRLKETKDVQVVLVTFVQQLAPIRDFKKRFGLAAYPNITLGTEGYTYELQQFFGIKNTPYIAIYDKKGKLVKAYEKAPDMTELFSTLKKA